MQTLTAALPSKDYGSAFSCAMRTTTCSRYWSRSVAATAAGAVTTAEALANREMDRSGLWLAEQVLNTGPFLSRLAAMGLVPVITER